MEQDTRNARTIDEQGRVFIPRRLMHQLGWGSGDELAFGKTSRAIVMHLIKPHNRPRCIICTKLEHEVEMYIHGAAVCSGCLQAIVQTNAAAGLCVQG